MGKWGCVQWAGSVTPCLHIHTPLLPTAIGVAAWLMGQLIFVLLPVSLFLYGALLFHHHFASTRARALTPWMFENKLTTQGTCR